MCFGCSSSPDDDRQLTVGPEANPDQAAAPVPRFAEKTTSIELVDQAQLNSKLGEESSSVEKIDTQPHSPDLFGDKKVSDNSEGQAGSSSGSDGSNSESESDSGTDSGSDSGSHSRSKSRSPVGSKSGSSSDSESDASSNSKQGSDIEVDIMTSDDEKEPSHKLKASDSLLPTSSTPWRSPDDRAGQNGIDVKLDGHGPNTVEFEKDLPGGDQETEMANLVYRKEDRKPAEESKPISSDGDDHQEQQLYTENLFNEREIMFKDGFKREQSDSSEGISKGKSRKASDGKRFDDKSDRMKRSKVENISQPPASVVRNTHFSDLAQNESPDRLIEGHYKAPVVQMTNRADRDGNADFGLQKGYAPVPGKSIPDSQQSGRRPVDRNARAKVPDTAERPSKYAESLEHGLKYSESSFQANEGFSMQKDKAYRETQDEDGYANEKKMPKNIKDGGFGDKYSFDSHEKKHELVGKFKEARQVSNSFMGSSPMDNSRYVVDKSPMVNGRGIVIQRELSDLELGELREPLPEETPRIKKQFERKSSFKQSENKPSTSDNWNSGVNRGKHVGKTTLDSGKLSPSHLGAGVYSNPEASSKKRSKEHNVEDIARPHHRIGQSQPQQVSRVDHAEVGSQINRLTDVSSKYRHNDAGANQGVGPEDYGEAPKRMPVSAALQHDTKRGLAPHCTKESKTQKSDTVPDLSDKQKDAFFTDSSNNGRKRRESSSDENSCSYSKYEKEEPELKGPIRDFSQ